MSTYMEALEQANNMKPMQDCFIRVVNHSNHDDPGYENHYYPTYMAMRSMSMGGHYEIGLSSCYEHSMIRLIDEDFIPSNGTPPGNRSRKQHNLIMAMNKRKR
jgi:hypothetical protein